MRGRQRRTAAAVDGRVLVGWFAFGRLFATVVVAVGRNDALLAVRSFVAARFAVANRAQAQQNFLGIAVIAGLGRRPLLALLGRGGGGSSIQRRRVVAHGGHGRGFVGIVRAAVTDRRCHFAPQRAQVVANETHVAGGCNRLATSCCSEEKEGCVSASTTKFGTQHAHTHYFEGTYPHRSTTTLLPTTTRFPLSTRWTHGSPNRLLRPTTGTTPGAAGTTVAPTHCWP